ncbi:MAG: hypothetical protein JSV13_11030 [Nitrospiraceae bacterium]|jgi:ABC-type molybdate transport system permease subunit|nr:MAG: hypothetical protein JSV13_11030 [Nitrospiraceae bacterium]
MKNLLLILLSFIIAFTPAMALAFESDKTEAIAADTLLMRPLGLASLVVGTSLFIVSFPFSMLGNNVHETQKVLIEDPFNYTFKRPVGEFEYEGEDY